MGEREKGGRREGRREAGREGGGGALSLMKLGSVSKGKTLHHLPPLISVQSPRHVSDLQAL